MKKKKAIEFVNVYQSYDKKSMCLYNINLDIFYNDFTVIFGESGSGKTTLIKTIIRSLPLFKGQQYLYDEEENKIPYTIHNLHKYIQIVDQNFQQIFNPFYTVYDFLYESLLIHHKLNIPKHYFNMSRLEIEQTIIKVLKLFNLSHNIMYKNIFNLSFGQQQRVMLSRVWLLKPKIIILDEATSSWDIINIFNVLLQIQNVFQTIIVISHNIRIFTQFADHIIVLKNGKIIDDMMNIKNNNTLSRIENQQYRFKNVYTKKLFELI